MTCWSLAFVRWLTSRACVTISSLVCTTYCRPNKLIFMKTFSVSTRILPSFRLVHELLSFWTIFAHLYCVGRVRRHLHGKWTALRRFKPRWIRAEIILWVTMTMFKQLQYCSWTEACLKRLFGIPYNLNFNSMHFRCQNLDVICGQHWRNYVIKEQILLLVLALFRYWIWIAWMKMMHYFF